LNDAEDLGEIFFTWEFATAIAGALLGIDAFDQPNVQESKDNTKRLLEEYKSSGKLNDPDLVPIADAADKVASLLAGAKPGDYVSLTEYVAPAQAIGDYESLKSRGRRAVRLDLGDDVDGDLARLADVVKMVKA